MFKTLWRMAGGSAVAAGTVGLSADLVLDFGRFLQMLLMPDFADPELAARVLGALSSVVIGIVIGISKTLVSGESRTGVSGLGATAR